MYDEENEKVTSSTLPEGTYTVRILPYRTANDFSPYSYTVTAAHVHTWSQPAFSGIAQCEDCTQTRAETFRKELDDTFTAGAWDTQIGFTGAGLGSCAGKGFSYGALGRGQTVTLSGTIGEVSPSAIWNTPLVGFYAQDGNGVLLRMDDWTIASSADGLFTNPSLEYAGAVLVSGRADSNSIEWFPFRTGESWEASVAANSSYTLVYSFDANGVLTVTQTVSKDGSVHEQINTVYLPVTCNEVNLYLYGENCTFSFSRLTSTTNRVLSLTAHSERSEYASGNLLDFSELTVTAERDSGSAALSHGDYTVWASMDGVRCRITPSTPLSADMDAVYVVYGGQEAQLEVTIAPPYYTITASGSAALNAKTLLTVSFGNALTQTLTLTVNNQAASLSSLTQGSELGGLTVQSISLEEGSITVTVPALRASTQALGYSLSVEEEGNRLAAGNIFYSDALAADGEGYFATPVAGVLASGSAAAGELWLIDGRQAENPSPIGLRFAAADASSAARPAFELVFYEGAYTGCRELMQAITARYTLPMQNGGQLFLFVFDAEKTGGMLEVTGTDGVAGELYVPVDGGAVRYRTDDAAAEQITVREATCGVRGIFAYRAEGHLFHITYSQSSALHDWTEEGSCSVCAARRESVEQDGVTYETVIPEGEPILNTDYSADWWNEGGGGAVGRDVPGQYYSYEGNFLLSFTWTQTGGSKQMYCTAQLYAPDKFWTLQGDGSVDGAIADALSPAVREFTLQTAEGLQRTEVQENAAHNPYLIWDESNYDGSYRLTVRRIGSVLTVALVFTAADGAVCTVTCTQSGFPEEGIMCFLAGNPYYADDITMATGTITQSM